MTEQTTFECCVTKIPVLGDVFRITVQRGDVRVIRFVDPGVFDLLVDPITTILLLCKEAEAMILERTTQ